MRRRQIRNALVDHGLSPGLSPAEQFLAHETVFPVGSRGRA
ncbi:hypothetical protein [Nonomuraea candida]|nr:hypothetical protein [Nonomuraea candida]